MTFKSVVNQKKNKENELRKIKKQLRPETHLDPPLFIESVVAVYARDLFGMRNHLAVVQLAY